MSIRTCPRCGVISEATVGVCECGHSFVMNRVRPKTTPGPRVTHESVLAISDSYRALVLVVLLEAAIGVVTGLGAMGVREEGHPELIIPVNLVGLAMLLTLVILIAQRTHDVAGRMGSPSPRAWALVVGAFGVFGLLAFQNQGRIWSRRHGISFGLFGPDRNDARRVDRARSSDVARSAAVEGTLVFGGVWRRSFALFLDGVLVLVSGFAFFAAAGFLSDPLGVVRHYSPILEGWLGIVLGIVGYAVFEGSRLKGTPGKWAVGLAVEDGKAEDAGASFLQALWRNTTKHVSGAVFPVSLLMGGLTRKKRMPHDFLARTVVVRRKRSARELRVCAAFLGALSALFLASLVVWQHQGRPSQDRERFGLRARGGFPMRVESLPALNPGQFFEETHAACFGNHYQRKWDGNLFDRAQYLQCMDAAYVLRFAEAVVLEAVDFGAHVVDGESDPMWTNAVVRGRVVEGRLGDSLVLQNETRCDGQSGYTSNDFSLDRRELTLGSGGTFKISKLHGIQIRPCRWTLSLRLGRIPYGKPLTVDLPLADPVLVALKDEEHREYLAALAEAKACRKGAADALLAQDTGEMSPEVRKLVNDLSLTEQDASRRAVSELMKLGVSARAAIPALLPILEDRGYEGQQAAQALVALDPEGSVVTPVLVCQLREPDPQWRYSTASLLAQGGDQRGLDALAAGLKAGAVRHRFAAIAGAQAAGSKAASMVPALIECAKSRKLAQERAACLGAMPHLDPTDPRALRALAAAAETDVESSVRDRARSASRDAQDRRARAAAASPEAAARCLGSDPSADLRLRCLYLATAPRPFGTAAAAALKKAVNDPDPRVRSAARDALRSQ